MAYHPSSAPSDAAINEIKTALGGLGVEDSLLTLRSLAALLGTRRAASVLAARAEGLSWQEIADRLGMSRQSVWQRYGAEEVDPPRPARGRPPRPRPGLHAYSNCASYKAVTTRPH